MLSRFRRSAALLTAALALSATAVALPRPDVDVDRLGDLPLTLVPSAGPAASYAIFLSGDGGWARLAATVAANLAPRGVETIGFSTLRYYWDAKPALQTAADLNRIFDAIRAVAPDAKVDLIGFSYGAAIAPVVYPLLSDASKAMVARLTLLVPDAKAGIVDDDAPTPPPGETPAYVFRTTLWQDDDPAEGYDIAAAIRADAAQRPVLCVYSSDDDGACPRLAGAPPANVTLTRWGEGHHFGGDYAALAALIAAP